MTLEEYRNSLLRLPEFRMLTVSEEIDYIDGLENWGDADQDCWDYLCDQLGIDYSAYDDPDKLFEDIKKTARDQKVL